MSILLVAPNPKEWPLAMPGLEVVSPRAYLTDPKYTDLRGIKLFNLARSYRYQSIGYYVSLLAEARGHKPMPSVATIEDMKSQAIVRYGSDDLENLIQKSLAPIQSNEFTLSIYFGRNLAKRYDRLSIALFNLFQAPLVRARFARAKTHQKWQLASVGPIAANDIPDEHWPFVLESAQIYFARRTRPTLKRTTYRWDLAILHNPDEQEAAPSDPRALKKFVKAAENLGLATELVTRDDYGRLAEFDALFIRETTRVNHHTYRFSRRAEREGLVVVDDPGSIVRCTNKVYLAELLERHGVATPKTRILHKDNVDAVVQELGLPCVLKQPDSSFSQGVVKVEDQESYERETERLLDKSDLVIAQEFVPTSYDWRVGVFDKKALYVCKYFMVQNHWQILQRNERGRLVEGEGETMRVEDAPEGVVRQALRAANLIGDGLYGVDLKEINGRYAVIEVNDNPSIDAGVEDRVLGDELYTTIMEIFQKRIEHAKVQGARRE